MEKQQQIESANPEEEFQKKYTDEFIPLSE